MPDEDRLSRLESEVDRISRAVERLDARLRSLETSSAEPSGRPRATSSAVEAHVAPSDSEIARAVAFIGRTLLILGGAYLLRAVTESGAIVPLGGAALGFVYAVFWLLLADVAGARGRSLSAAFFGGSAILVAFPLLWETTSRFELLPPAVGAASLGVVSLVAIAVAWRRRLRSLAWVTVVGAGFTSLALIVGTRETAPFGLLLVIVAVATLWLAYHTRWPVVHWVAAGAADVVVLLLTLGTLIEREETAKALPVAVQLLLFLGFTGTFLVRALTRAVTPGLFDLVQTLVVTLIGYGGALVVAPAAVARGLGAMGILAAASLYAIRLISRRADEPAKEYFGNLALVLLLLGALVPFGEPGLFLSLVGVGLAATGSRLARPQWRLHGALVLLAAAASSGLVTLAGYAFVVPATYAWPPARPLVFLPLAAAALSYTLTRPGNGVRWFVRWRLARLLELVVLVLGLGSLLAKALVFTIGSPGPTADPALVATLRTGVLAGSALVLSWLSGWERFREASWLVYPTLTAGGIKLLVEDFPQGRSTTLFVALALYGGALLLAPRAGTGRSDDGV